MSAQESLSIILNQPGFPRARPLSSDSKAGITEERATELINYQRNLEELRNTLSQVDSLLAEPPTPEIAAKCASLLGYVAAIDLPQEVKNQEAGRYPPQVQEQVHRALETQGTSTTRSAEAAAYGTAIMQRVAEEAQVRIQLEAKAAYEESRKVYEQQMQAYEMAFRDLDESVMKKPYTAQNVERYQNGTKEICHNMKKASEQQNQNAERSAQNMSPKDRDELIRNQQNKEEEQRRKAQEERERAQRLREEAKRYPPNSDEYKWCMQKAAMCEYRAGTYDEMAYRTGQSIARIRTQRVRSKNGVYKDVTAQTRETRQDEVANKDEIANNRVKNPKGISSVYEKETPEIEVASNCWFAQKNLRRIDNISTIEEKSDIRVSDNLQLFAKEARNVKEEQRQAERADDPELQEVKRQMIANISDRFQSFAKEAGNVKVEQHQTERTDNSESQGVKHQMLTNVSDFMSAEKDLSLDGHPNTLLVSAPKIAGLMERHSDSYKENQGLKEKISESSQGEIHDNLLLVNSFMNNRSMG